MLLRSLCVAAATVVFAVASNAQEAKESQRYPATGNAILDCDPVAPAPETSCVLRMPPGYERETPRAEARDEGDAPAFQLLRRGRSGFPSDLTMSSTLVLVDLSPGPNAGRRATFAQERALIADFVSALPRDETVAIYGFNERLMLLQDFTTDRNALLDTVDDLELTGTNTRIATFVGDAISVLDERDDTILRNLVLVSDGQEEGRQPLTEVVDTAIDAGVVVSALGMFWRPVGSAETGSGMDYLRALTEDSSGIAAQVLLRRPQDAGEVVSNFARAISDSITSSGLIIPQDEPRAATITLTLREPVVGVAGEFRPRDIEVAYLPADTNGANEDADPAETVEPDTIFGFPTLYVYATAGVLAVLLLVGLALAAMRRGRNVEEQDGSNELEDDASPEDDAPPTRAVSKPQAYLVLAGSNRRIAIGSPRVSIGRGGSNEVVIDDESISRLHAQLHRNRDGGFSITDMDSLNGTYVNGDRINGTMVVKPGDTVAFGNVSTRLTPA